MFSIHKNEEHQRHINKSFGYVGFNQAKKVKESESEVAQSCPTLCDPVDGSLPGSSIHGILQARILEWVTISFSSGSSRPRDRIKLKPAPN